MSSRHLLLITCSLASLAAAHAPSWGQTSGTAQPPGTPATSETALKTGKQGNVEEVVVTAQRRAERISRVPVTVSAFSAASLQQRSIHQESDLQSSVPGLTVKVNASANQMEYAIRGQSLDAFSGSPPDVLAYMNELPMSPHTESSVAFYDLSSVQVLKGPQGTLFGRNDTGGAILYSSEQPSDRYAGFLTARVGSYNLREVQGAVNLPIKPDILEVRVAGDSLNNNGYEHNILTGRTLGDTSAWSGRATVKFTPNEDISNVTMFQYSHDIGTEIAPFVYSAYAPGAVDNLGKPLPDLAYLFSGGQILSYLDQQKARGYFDGELTGLPTHPGLDDVPYHKAWGVLAENTTTYTLNDNLRLKNIFGFVEDYSDSVDVFSGSPFPILEAVDPRTGRGDEDDQMGISEEFQVQGDALDKTLKYIAGVFYINSSDTQVNPLNFGPVPFFEDHFTTTDNSRAVFAQTTYDLSRMTTVNGLSITTGIRYSWDSLRSSKLPGDQFYGAPDQSSSESNPSWQIGLNYQITAHELLYFVTRGSWRAGGYNNGSPTDNLDHFNAERTHDYELGSKFAGPLWGLPSILNIALYDQITDDAQRTFYATGSNGAVTAVTANVPQSEARGFEIDGEMRLTDWLRVGGAVSYTYAQFTKPVAEALGSTVVFTKYGDTPRWTGSAYAETKFPVPDTYGAVIFRVDGYSQTKQDFVSLPYPGTTLPGYTLVNLRLGWQNIMQSQFSTDFYIKNLADERYFLGGSSLAATLGLNLATAGPPRMFGGEVSYKF